MLFISRFVNHDSVNPNVRVEVIYEEKNTVGTKNYNKMISNEMEDKTLAELEMEENHGTEKPRSVATEKKENSEKKNTWKSKSKSKSKSKQRQFEIRMTALRDIKKGEEMCFDYGPLYSPSAGWAL